MGESLASERPGQHVVSPGEAHATRATQPLRRLVYAWATLGVLLLLMQGVIKLVPVAAQAIRGPLSTMEAGMLWSFVVLNLYLEGYRGFQLRFVPRVVSRALYLARASQPATWHVVAAPLFAMGFFHAQRRARWSAWIVTSLVAMAVVLVRHLPSPWRGIVDAGVVAGLGYGTLVFLAQAVKAAVTGVARADAEVPDSAPPRP